MCWFGTVVVMTFLRLHLLMTGVTTMADSQYSKNRIFEKTTMGYLNELFGTALRLTRNERDAEDLVQDTYLKAFKSFHQYKIGTNCRAWMFRILTNTFINGYRRRVKERDILDRKETGRLTNSLLCKDSLDRFSNPERRVVKQALSDDVQIALDEIPEEFRMAVILADIRDFSYKEIAEIMDTPIGTVMSRLFRGRRLLRAALQDYAVKEGYIKRLVAVPA
ncbi:MAG TPA: sigma-70 family RNA polymerase sigma factor [Myxococcales bacterium]|nr:sigma-70 family RNA polymerase sigma factor [Myxococcales bacterium]